MHTLRRVGAGVRAGVGAGVSAGVRGGVKARLITRFEHGRGLQCGPRYTPVVSSLPSMVPFVGPEEQERQRGRPFAVRLGANESTFGPSPKAVAAMSAAAADVWMYGDPKSHELRHALASHYGISPSNLVVGEGVDGLLAYSVRLVVGEGDAVVTTAGTYPTLNYFVAGCGGSVHTVPYAGNDTQDLDALLSKAREVAAKVVYVVNPDNPSGTWHEGGRLQAMARELPDGCVLLLDEAYSELGPAATDSLPFIPATHPGVLRLRTFSKAYGMAGARVGYAIADESLITAFDKIRNHFGVNRIAQAGALAALGDQGYLRHVQQRVEHGRAALCEVAHAHNLTPLPSATNFVTMDCGGGGDFARAVMKALLERDVFVRMPGLPPLDRCIRVSCSGPAELEVFKAALPEALDAARQAVGSG